MPGSFFSELAGFLQQGGYVMPPLLLATVILWLAIGYRHCLLRRGDRRSVRVLLQRARDGQLTRARGMIDAAVLRGMAVLQRHPVNPRPYLDDAFADYHKDLRRYARPIASIVVAAPLLGLLGTVAGMIETFASLGDMSLYSQSGGIAGGISQALFTTQMGLAVAIPGLLIKGALDRRQTTLELELAQVKDLLSGLRNGGF